MNNFKELDYCFEYQGSKVYQTPRFDSLAVETQQLLEPQLFEIACSGFRRAGGESYE